MEENKFWLWKDIRISIEYIGDTIKKGSGVWEKEYTYIKIPKGYNYDNYCFLLSDNCVHINIKGESYFSLNSGMKLELIYDPEKRKEGSKYPRYKLTGEELFEQVFKDYEVNFAKEYEERAKKEATEKEKKDRAIKGSIVCGLYTGNVYCGVEPKYNSDYVFKAYFKGNDYSTYYSSKFQKVQNVDVKFVVMENVSRYHFLQYEDIINSYLAEIYLLTEVQEKLHHRYMCKTDMQTKSRMPKWEQKRYCAKMDTADVFKELLNNTEKCIEEIKEKLQKHILALLEQEH